MAIFVIHLVLPGQSQWSALFSGTILWYLMQHQQCPLSQRERVRVRGFVP